MVELCKKFKFPNIKYDKKKYNHYNNPDVIMKCTYFKEHIVECMKCNVINNNRYDLSHILTKSKIFYKEFKETGIELDDGIDMYQFNKKFDGFGFDVDTIHMKLNHIIDEDNIYMNHILIYTTIPKV
jgi:hypothetical protein